MTEEVVWEVEEGCWRWFERWSMGGGGGEGGGGMTGGGCGMRGGGWLVREVVL